MGALAWQVYLVAVVGLSMLACAVGVCLKRALEVEEGWGRKMLFAGGVSMGLVLPLSGVMVWGLWAERAGYLNLIEQAKRGGVKVEEDLGKGYVEYRVWGGGGNGVGWFTEYRVQTMGAIMWRGLSTQMAGAGGLFFPSWLVIRLVRVRRVESVGFAVETRRGEAGEEPGRGIGTRGAGRV